MRYIQKQIYSRLRAQYATIIGWGAGVEFQKFYEHNIFHFDHVIDGAGRNVGRMINGIMIQGIEAVGKYQDKDSVLIVIYPNIESEIIQQIKTLLPGADTIVARLLTVEGKDTTYSTDREDLLMLDYMRSRHSRFTYMDIGVCHPVVRNNTFLFYENGFTEGVLVEPNVQMCKLPEEYRPFNRVVNLGALPENGTGELTYYYDTDHPGLNTFSETVAMSRGMSHNSMSILTKDINEIIAENFTDYPNVLDIDTEGMDYDLLAHLDLIKYPVDLICVEASSGGRTRALLTEKGYRLLALTTENEIYVRG